MDEKLFKCKYCDKGFTYRITYMAHMREKHLNIFPYVCIIRSCIETFSIKKKMISHIRNDHKNIIKDLVNMIKEESINK